MPSREEKQRRRELLRHLKQVEQARAEDAMPLAKADLKDLFDYVDAKLQAEGCDRTLAGTLAFLRERQLPEQSIVEWLREYGGYCDCEVIANVEGEWGEVVGSI